MKWYKWYKTEYGLTTDYKIAGKDAPYVVSEKETGKPKMIKRGDAVFEETDCLRLFSDETTELIKGYYVIIHPKKGHENGDICMYCGADNTTPQGESLRQSWDCYNCGSN